MPYQDGHLDKASTTANVAAGCLEQRRLAGAWCPKDDTKVGVVGVQELLDEHAAHGGTLDVARHVVLLGGRAKASGDLRWVGPGVRGCNITPVRTLVVSHLAVHLACVVGLHGMVCAQPQRACCEGCCNRNFVGRNILDGFPGISLHGGPWRLAERF